MHILKNINTPTIVFLSTYPPRECGIATFSQDLLQYCQQFLGTSVTCKVAAFNLTPLDTHNYPSEVEWQIDQNNKKTHANLAKSINHNTHISGVIIQHEYGIFGGKEGVNILTFMQICKKPMLVTLHTILPLPTDEMKEVTIKIIDLAATIVVLTAKSKELLEKIYPNSIGKVFIIPHGIHPVPFSLSRESKKILELKKFTVLSTFGLLSSGKGIEYVIRSLPKVIKKNPSILYLVLGQTHPVIVRNEGEKYRIKLLQLITKLGLEKHVKFYDQYLSLPELFEFLRATDIYISTSTNPNQAVSGTLSYALGAGRAVISTQFAQAKEIVSEEIGRLVPIKDSNAITNAILDLLSNPERLKRMHLKAYESTRYMLWSNVAEKYINLLSRTIIPEINVKHLYAMTDKFGLFQFASLSAPNQAFGYTLDDNARAGILCSWLAKQTNTKELEQLIKIYLTFIQTCQLKNGSFINYIDHSKKMPTDQNNKEDLEDTQARALWALSEIISNASLPTETRELAKSLFLQKYRHMSNFTHLRAMAYAIKSYVLVQSMLPEFRDELNAHIQTYAETLINALTKNTEKSWHWFENHLSYNNGILSEGLLIAGQHMNNFIYKEKALSSLEFLIKSTFIQNTYIPIGQLNWYKKNNVRSEYDQQPEDPASMISALVYAYKLTHNKEYQRLAEICFNWFLGRNSLNISLYDKKTGGCYDGLRPDSVNLNQGAESLLAYLMSNLLIRELN